MASRSWSCTICSRKWIRASLVLRGSENRVKKLSWGSKMLSVFTSSTYLCWNNSVSTARHEGSATALAASLATRTCHQAHEHLGSLLITQNSLWGNGSKPVTSSCTQMTSLGKISGKDLCKVTCVCEQTGFWQAQMPGYFSPSCLKIAIFFSSPEN